MVPHWGILDIELLREKRKPTYLPASIQKRFFNLLIDYLAILNLAILVGVVFGVLFVMTKNAEWISGEQNIFKNSFIKITLSLAIIFFYYFFCETFLQGKTLGKYATKTSVRKLSGEKPTSKDIFIRCLLRFIPFEPISFLFGKKGWHDEFSDTHVVNDLQ